MIDEFPYIFGGLALSMGVSSLLNGSIVLKYGMLRLINLSLLVAIISSLTYLFFFSNGSNPSLTLLIIFLAIQFMCLGFIYGNLSALAMEPIGHIAGIGAAIFSFSAMALAVMVAIAVGMFIKETALPLFVGFFVTGVIGIILIRYNSKTLLSKANEK